LKAYNFLHLVVDCTNVTYMPTARFVSEYGWQSYDSLETLKTVSSSQDWFFDSPLMRHRQHHPRGNQEILQQIQLHFNYNPTGEYGEVPFRKFIYLSQATQAMCIRAQSEYFRSSQSLPQKTMGAIYWYVPSPTPPRFLFSKPTHCCDFRLYLFQCCSLEMRSLNMTLTF
jgi:beta-mannosidase